MTLTQFFVTSEGPAKPIIPELPNFITLLHHKFHGAAWVETLHHWESVVFSLIIAIVVSFIFYCGTRKRSLIPGPFQNFLELIVEGFRYLVLGILGRQGEEYIPLLGTLFVYILAMNFMGLVPFMKSPSSDLNITIGLAVCVFCLVQYLNIRHMGFFGFLYHLSGSPKDVVGWCLVPLILPVEIITQFARPLTLAFRLFGNILGEDALIAAFAIFGVSLASSFHSPIGFPLQIPFMFLGMLTGLMQALVFTLLSTVYILLSLPHDEEKTLD